MKLSQKKTNTQTEQATKIWATLGLTLFSISRRPSLVQMLFIVIRARIENKVNNHRI